MAMMRNYGAIYDYALINSFWGFLRFIDSPKSYATLDCGWSLFRDVSFGIDIFKNDQIEEKNCLQKECQYKKSQKNQYIRNHICVLSSIFRTPLVRGRDSWKAISSPDWPWNFTMSYDSDVVLFIYLKNRVTHSEACNRVLFQVFRPPISKAL